MESWFEVGFRSLDILADDEGLGSWIDLCTVDGFLQRPMSAWGEGGVDRSAFAEVLRSRTTFEACQASACVLARSALVPPSKCEGLP